jgi:hypothetical protein
MQAPQANSRQNMQWRRQLRRDGAAAPPLRARPESEGTRQLPRRGARQRRGGARPPMQRGAHGRGRPRD